MNLYKIIFSHTAPKDTEFGLVEYLIADNENDVYEHIDKEFNYGCWNDKNNESGELEIYNDDYDVIGTETFKEKMIRIKGEINDDDYDFSDSYYGITLYGWEKVKDNINEDEIFVLTENNIASVFNIK
jgi:hypothetical protein